MSHLHGECYLRYLLGKIFEIYPEIPGSVYVASGMILVIYLAVKYGTIDATPDRKGRKIKSTE